MATRALIAYLDTDGTTKLTTTYNHYDGYPENLGKALENFFDSDSLAKDLANYGYVSYIDPETGEIEANNTQFPGMVQLPDNFNEAMMEIAAEVDSHGGDYGYIWDNENGEWITVKNNGIGAMTKDLEMALAHLKDKFSMLPDQPEQTMENYQSKWKKFLNENPIDMPGFEDTTDNLNNLSIYSPKPDLGKVLSQALFKLQDEPEVLLNAYKKSLANDIRLNGKEGYADYSVEDFIEDYNNYTSDKMGY
jgi:hypothetical protein